MDANGTRFHLLLGKEDWARCTHMRDDRSQSLGMSWETLSPLQTDDEQAGLDWDEKRSEITLKPRVFQFTGGTTSAGPRLHERRGAASDRVGNWYWIDEAGTAVRVTSACSETAFPFWSGANLLSPPSSPPGAFQPLGIGSPPGALPLRGLAVTTEQYLVVGVLQPAGLLIFDLYAEGPPRQLFWPVHVPFAPFDMTPTPDGGVAILDRDNARCWTLDRHFLVVPPAPEDCPPCAPINDFHPCDGSHRPLPSPPAAPPISLALSVSLGTLDAVAIEGLPDGGVLILESHAGARSSRIWRYRNGQQIGYPVSTEIMGTRVAAAQRDDFRLLGHDFAFVPAVGKPADAPEHRLYVVGQDGNQAFAFEATPAKDQLHLRPLADYLPMRLFGFKGLVAAGAQAYYDFGERWLPLAVQRRPRYQAAATFFTPAFDGKEPDCVWHRLMLDGCLPPETQVEVWSRAANRRAELAFTEWRKEPNPYPRGDGSEQPFARQSVTEHRGTWELLFQQAAGRFLELKLRLSGDGRTTPRLRALRAYYPRFSYLAQYLPAVYRQDDSSASFLDRFLANLEGVHTALEDKIAAVQVLFDADGAPPEVLDWLAGWFGVALDPGWVEAKRRLFLRHAMFFFQYRGTLRGLRMALHLALEDCVDESLFTDLRGRERGPERIRIVEHFRTRQTPGVFLGDPTELVGPRRVEPASRWEPKQGADELHRRYRAEFALPAGRLFPLASPPPTDARPGPQDWKDFAQRTLGFVPAAADFPPALWRAFLARRYPSVAAFNLAYGLGGRDQLADFGEVPLPGQVPVGEAPLRDWYQYEAEVLPMRRAAHHFTVLLPAPTEARDQRAEQRRRLDLAYRLLELEKPAHTRFDVKFYWAYFRIGAARLGYDTLLDQGSRVTELLQPLVLGEAHLAESYLAPALVQR